MGLHLDGYFAGQLLRVMFSKRNLRLHRCIALPCGAAVNRMRSFSVSGRPVIVAKLLLLLL